MAAKKKTTINVQGVAVAFLGIWEQINNPDFNPLEFEGIKNLIQL